MRTRFIVLITLGVVLVLSGVVAAGAALVQAATSALDDIGPVIGAPPGVGALVEGDPADPHAKAPLECAEDCFTDDVVEQLVIPGRDFATLGLPALSYGWGDYDPTTPGVEWYYNSETWQDEGGTPTECSFTFSASPISNSADDQPRKVERDDTVDYLGQHNTEDEYSYVLQSVRLFRTSGDAVEHMEEMSQNIANCSTYKFAPSSDYSGGTVTPEPALALPDSVAAVGWAETNFYGRYYIFDVQRGNLVIRTTLSTDGTITEQDLRAFVETSADDLASIPLPTA